jgi:pyruvyl transferase EpsO
MFDVPTHLCPDTAFCLGPLDRDAAGQRGILWLARSDLEARELPAAPAGGAERVDWLDEPRTARWRWERQVARFGARHPAGIAGRMARWTAGAMFGGLARHRLARGVRLLAPARAVITDRLHAHILCLLLGIPNVLLDNIYGKLRAFHETWTADSTLTRLAREMPEAMALVTDAGRP